MTVRRTWDRTHPLIRVTNTCDPPEELKELDRVFLKNLIEHAGNRNVQLDFLQDGNIAIPADHNEDWVTAVVEALRGSLTPP